MEFQKIWNKNKQTNNPIPSESEQDKSHPSYQKTDGNETSQ